MSEYSEPMRFIDLVTQQKAIRPELEAAINRVLDHGVYIMGPEVKQLEQRLSEFTGARYALTCANGTDALSLVLMAWGVGPGDAVFVPAFTYVATAEAPAQLGATPFFVDVSEDSFNMDPESLKQAISDSKKLGLRPAVVIPVDLFGQPAPVDLISDVAHEEGVKVLVDGAQSFGATSNGRRVGTMGDATTTSFFPAKPLGCYGDGGAVFIDDDDDAERINSIRLHGKGSEKYDNVRVGLNSRLDTLQAAILIEKLNIFPRELELRSKVAENYEVGLSDVLRTPSLERNTTSAWAQYTLIIESRDKLQKRLKDKGTPSVVYYPIPLSKQTGYAHFPAVSTGVKTSEYLAAHVISLPMHPYLSIADQRKIIEEVKESIQ
ncbi:DegT/DnrJ/EryC1/StrS family aminotransferase [Pseudomonadales bacterium]|nr:DegT/DnrJ/EryC1/StrS family aminotransferase [Pseudomonadales bacterium]